MRGTRFGSTRGIALISVLWIATLLAVMAASFVSTSRTEARLARNQTKALSQFGYRCAAHEYRLLASGHAHFVVYSKLMPWDHLAGALIHAEAGGYAARFDGSAYLPSHAGGGLLVAPDKESWRELHRELWAE